MNAKHTRHDVLVIGAGFAGMYLIRKLRDELGFDVRSFERGDDVGGTWYWNRYPGARCDVESMFYCYSFDDELQQEWVWTERYPAQPEILEYARHVADRFDLRRDIEFGIQVEGAVFNETTSMWTISTDTGRTATAPFLVTGVGCLSVPSTPHFPGSDSFKGEIHHTGQWPHEDVSFTDKRVAVIGTGSSGIQAIPVIAQEAAELTIFQRTATFTVPARNRPLTEIEQQQTKECYPSLRSAARLSRSGYLRDLPIGPGQETDPTVANSELERRWWRDSLGIPGVFDDTVLSVKSNEIVSQFVRDKIHHIVHDEETARLLEPHDYPIGTKRIVIDSGYYDTFNLPHVRLVDVRDTPIDRITARGIVVGATEYEVDAIVMATGYDAMTGALNRIRIEGVGGQLLSDAWAEGPKAYLGLAVHGFPNLFTVTGPGSPSVLSNMIVSIEQHVEWIGTFLDHLRRSGVTRIEASGAAQEEWVSHVNDLASQTLYPSAASWYMGANIPGKPRVFMPYLGGVGTYRAHCDEVAAAGYTGFDHQSGVEPGRRLAVEEVTA